MASKRSTASMILVPTILFAVLACSLSLDDGYANQVLHGSKNSRFISAARAGDSSTLLALLSLWADVDTQEVFGETALIGASSNGHVEVVNALLHKRARIDAHSILAGNTALIMADGDRHPEIVKTLLRHRAKIYAHNHNGNTALILAGEYDKLEDVQTRLLSRAHMEAANEDGHMALAVAGQWGRVEVVETLLQHRADNTHKNVDGMTALELAMKSCHNSDHKEEIVSLLRSWGQTATTSRNVVLISAVVAFVVIVCGMVIGPDRVSNSYDLMNIIQQEIPEAAHVNCSFKGYQVMLGHR